MSNKNNNQFCFDHGFSKTSFGTTIGRTRFVLLQIISYSLLALTAQAQTQEQSDSGNENKVTILPEIVVTASSIQQAREDVGSSVTVITAEDIKKKQAVFVAEVLRDVPGLAVQRSGSSATITSVRVRGNEADHTLVIIDGIEVNDPSSGAFDFSELLADDIERIEVLRGAQSTIWGSNAVGGVINIISKKGRKGYTISANGGAGSFGSRRGNFAIRGGGDGFKLSFSGSTVDSNGFNISPDGSQNDGFESRQMVANAQFQPIDALEFSFLGRALNKKTDFDGYDFANQTAFDADNVQDDRNRYGRGQVKINLFDNAWQSIFGMSRATRDSDVVDTVFGDRANSSEQKAYDFKSSIFVDNADAFSSKHAFVIFAEHQEDNFSDTFGTDATRDTTSIGSEYILKLFNRWSMSASIRYDENEDFEDATTWRISTSYNLVEFATRIHSSFGRAVKNPTLFDLNAASPGFFSPNPNLSPEDSRSFDFGVEQIFFNDRVIVDVTYFRTDLKSEISNVIAGGVFTTVNENGNSRRWGIEMNMDAAVNEYFSLNGNYTYTKAQNADGSRELRRARHIASAGVDFNFPYNLGYIRLNGEFRSRSIDNRFSGTGDEFSTGGYGLVNLYSQYNINNYISLYSRVENLLDKDYQEQKGYETAGIAAYGGIKLYFDGNKHHNFE